MERPYDPSDIIPWVAEGNWRTAAVDALQAFRNGRAAPFPLVVPSLRRYALATAIYADIHDPMTMTVTIAQGMTHMYNTGLRDAAMAAQQPACFIPEVQRTAKEWTGYFRRLYAHVEVKEGAMPQDNLLLLGALLMRQCVFSDCPHEPLPRMHAATPGPSYRGILSNDL